MYIREFYYNDDNGMLRIEFSTDEDGDDSYRLLELILEDVMYYSPNIMYESDMYIMEEDDIIELVEQYLLDNNLPEEQSL